jgi:hypothetical protein
MLVLIVLGLLVFTTRSNTADLQVEVSTVDPGEQLEDPSVLESAAMQIETLPEQLVTPTDLMPVDDPLAAPPELVDLNLPIQPTAPAAPSSIEGAPIGLALKGREKGAKQVLLQKYGGTAATEKAVEAGLEWLAKQQKPDGTWSLIGPYTAGANSENVAAATAMALLAFQGYGDTHQKGKYAPVVARGWNALLKMQRKDGLFTGQMAMANQLLYTHAQCAIAACELYGMTNDSRFRGPAQRAIDYAVEAQDPQHGGWRYAPRKESDTSVTGWFVMALQSARMAGLSFPPEVLQNVSRYLDSAALDGGSRYGYQGTLQPSHAMAAEGLLCRQYLGWPQNDERLVNGVSSLVSTSPVGFHAQADRDVYYWYYATQAAHHMEGKLWDEWNQVMRKVMPESQIKEGAEAGSWEPRGDKWGVFNGRLYMTCLSIYMLEVYYRHLPIYTGYKAFSEFPASPAAEPAADGKPAADADPDPAAPDTPENPAPPAEKPEPAPPKTDAPKAGAAQPDTH